MDRLNFGMTHPQIHQADAVRARHFLFTSALMADDGKQGLAPEARINPGYPFLQPEIKLQTRVILTKLSNLLAATGADLSHVVKAHGFLVDPSDFTAMDEVWGEFFQTKVSRTFVSTPNLPVAGARICFDFIACMPGSNVEIVRANAGSPPPFTRKVEATRVGDLIFTSGQLGYDSRTGFAPEARRDTSNPAAGPDVVRQSRVTIGNLGKSLAAAGGDPHDIAKAQIYLSDMSNQTAFLADWRAALPSAPANSIVGEGFFVPEGLIEIDFTGYKQRPGLIIKSIGPEKSPKAFQVGEWLFSSGCVAVDEFGLVPLEATVHPTFPNYGSNIKLQTRYVLKDLLETLKAAGASLDSVCRAAVYLTDLRHFGAMDEVWKEFFPYAPARTVVATPSLGVPGALIAVDLVSLIS